MSIWKGAPTLEALNANRADTLIGHLDIVFTEIGEDFLSATMPVDERTRQPYGLLHGGASVVLAETLGSTGATLLRRPRLLSLRGPGNQRQPRARGQGWAGHRHRAPGCIWAAARRCGRSRSSTIPRN